MPLRTLVRIAFGTTGPQVVGGPSWVTSDGYDIVAKVRGEDAAAAVNGPTPELLAMLKTLLEDRFKLQVHPEKRDVQTYALVTARQDRTLGPALKASTVDCAIPAASCGIRGGNGNITYTGMTIAQIARSISGYPDIRRQVLDRASLAGRYDLHLEYSEDAGGPSNIFTALIEQAGLKLQPETNTIDIIVIDRAERPTDD